MLARVFGLKTEVAFTDLIITVFLVWPCNIVCKSRCY